MLGQGGGKCQWSSRVKSICTEAGCGLAYGVRASTQQGRASRGEESGD